MFIIKRYDGFHFVFFLYSLTKIAEVGLRARQVLRWQYRKPRCHKNVLSASSVNMDEFLPHLILLFLGFFLAIVVYTFELFVFQENTNSKSKIRSKKIILFNDSYRTRSKV